MSHTIEQPNGGDGGQARSYVSSGVDSSEMNGMAHYRVLEQDHLLNGKNALGLYPHPPAQPRSGGNGGARPQKQPVSVNGSTPDEDIDTDNLVQLLPPANTAYMNNTYVSQARTRRIRVPVPDNSVNSGNSNTNGALPKSNMNGLALSLASGENYVRKLGVDPMTSSTQLIPSNNSNNTSNSSNSSIPNTNSSSSHSILSHNNNENNAQQVQKRGLSHSMITSPNHNLELHRKQSNPAMPYQKSIMSNNVNNTRTRNSRQGSANVPRLQLDKLGMSNNNTSSNNVINEEIPEVLEEPGSMNTRISSPTLTHRNANSSNFSSPTKPNRLAVPESQPIQSPGRKQKPTGLYEHSTPQKYGKHQTNQTTPQRSQYKTTVKSVQEPQSWSTPRPTPVKQYNVDHSKKPVMSYNTTQASHHGVQGNVMHQKMDRMFSAPQVDEEDHDDRAHEVMNQISQAGHQIPFVEYNESEVLGLTQPPSSISMQSHDYYDDDKFDDEVVEAEEQDFKVYVTPTLDMQHMIWGGVDAAPNHQDDEIYLPGNSGDMFFSNASSSDDENPHSSHNNTMKSSQQNSIVSNVRNISSSNSNRGSRANSSSTRQRAGSILGTKPNMIGHSSIGAAAQAYQGGNNNMRKRGTSNNNSNSSRGSSRVPSSSSARNTNNNSNNNMEKPKPKLLGNNPVNTNNNTNGGNPKKQQYIRITPNLSKVSNLNATINFGSINAPVLRDEDCALSQHCDRHEDYDPSYNYQDIAEMEHLYSLENPSNSKDPKPLLIFGECMDTNISHRSSMEDQHVLKPGQHVSSALDKETANLGGFFSIYDGHGGVGTATCLKKNQHRAFRQKWGEDADKTNHIDMFADVNTYCVSASNTAPVKSPTSRLARVLTNPTNPNKNAQKSLTTNPTDTVIGRALYNSFVHVDHQIISRNISEFSGSTAQVVFIEAAMQDKVLHRWAHFANCGDAQAVLGVSVDDIEDWNKTQPSQGNIPVVSNTSNAAQAMTRRPYAQLATQIHVANDTAEGERIRAAGGEILIGRVQGQLAVTRAFGDSTFKHVGVIADPYYQCVKLTKRHKFIIVACDGLWDVMTHNEAVQAIWGMKCPEAMARKLLILSLRNRTKDNVSVIVIRLHEYDE